MFNPLHSSTNQEQHLCNQSRHYENTDDFHYEGKPSHATTKSKLFAVSDDEWDTKEDTGKSMKNALYILRYAKGTSQAEATSNSEKTKPIALALLSYACLKTSVSQSVT